MKEIIREEITEEELDALTVTDNSNPLPYIVIIDDVLNKIYLVTLPSPSAYSCTLKEVTASGAGRTEDMKMNKMMIGKYSEISATYAAMKTEEVSKLLQTFDKEYVLAFYFNPLKGEFENKEVYVGERNVPMYSAHLGIWDRVSVTLTQRVPDSIYAKESSPEEPVPEEPSAEVIA